MTTYFPVQHFDYTVMDQRPGACFCKLCKDFRATRARATKLEVDTADHPQRCRCNTCREKRSVQFAALAASNRRDTYSELTYLANEMPWRDTFLLWAFKRIAFPTDIQKKSNHWWQRSVEQKSLGSWLEDWLETRKRGVLVAAPVLLDHRFNIDGDSGGSRSA